MIQRASVVILFVLAMLPPMVASAQSAVVTSGGCISNATYKVGYSIGQVAVECNRTEEHAISEGVIQPLRVVEISEKEAISVFHTNIYPNPTTNIISLVSNNLEADTPIRLYSIDGKLLQSEIWVGNKITFDLINNKTGVYLLQVKDRIFKIIKK